MIIIIIMYFSKHVQNSKLQDYLLVICNLTVEKYSKIGISVSKINEDKP